MLFFLVYSDFFGRFGSFVFHHGCLVSFCRCKRLGKVPLRVVADRSYLFYLISPVSLVGMEVCLPGPLSPRENDILLGRVCVQRR